ncbi:MAG: hypothetical protein ACXVI9_07245, partial [Mucilaginibacter sp.]
LSLLTWALQHRYRYIPAVQPRKSARDTATRALVYDSKLLDQFESICKKYDSLSKGNYTMAGILNMTDGADTADRINHIAFAFCKAGQDFYYKMGHTEVVNEQGIYLFVDHDARKIIIGPHRGVQYGEPGIKPFASLGAGLRSEEYHLTGTRSGALQTISLINERHITCKQYSLTLDTASNQIKSIYARLTNFNEPLRKDKEKIIEVSLSEYDGKARLDRYLTPDDIIKGVGTSRKTTERFRDYQLINN